MSSYNSATAKSGYRTCVGILLLNDTGEIFVGQRMDSRQAGWQMPQGGIDEGESAEQAVWREMREEIGTDQADLLLESEVWRSYDLPREIAGRIWGGKYLGQTQRWFAFRFTGHNQDIDIHGHQREFSEWRWLEADQLLERVVSFKRDVYVSVVDEFRHLWA